MGRIFQLHGRLSGHVPQIAVVFGRLTAALAFPPAFCDYVVMLQNSAACLGAPSVVKQLIGEDGSLTDLGGPEMHTRISGYADQIAADEGEAFDLVRQMLSLVLRPKENAFAAPKTADWEVIDRFLSDRHRSFDMHCLIDCFVDQGSLLEFKPFFAAEVMTGLARVEGRTIGIIANNSLHRAGLIFPETCRKMMRFIKFCDSFSIPLLFIVDTPGFMVGRDVEKAGSIVQGSELFQTIASLRIPHMTLVARHAHTAGIYAMAGPGFSPALFCALPSASISIFEKKASERLSSSPALAGPVANALQELAAIEDSPLFFKTTGLLDEVIELKALRDVIRNFLPERQS
jgi:acetyl-CoA carboxylase carboxyltransferase component